MPLPEPGTKAPWVSGLLDQNGHPVPWSNLQGRVVVLFFISAESAPAGSSPGSGFTSAFQSIDAVVYGISIDQDAGGKDFIQRFGLPFDLIIDRDGSLCRAYGVATGADAPHHAYTVLIGADGRVARTWDGLGSGDHWSAVAKAVQRIVR